jgi:hypothetical protein
MPIVSLSPYKFVRLPCFLIRLWEIQELQGECALQRLEVDTEFCWGLSFLRKFIGLTRKHTQGQLSANHKLTFYLYEEESRLNATTTFSSLQFDIYHHLDRGVSDVDDKVSHETRTRRVWYRSLKKWLFMGWALGSRYLAEEGNVLLRKSALKPTHSLAEGSFPLG